MKTKRCSRCRLKKSVFEFSKNRRQVDGLQSQCKECSALSQGEHRARDAGRAKANDVKSFSKYYLTSNGRATFMLGNARARARRLGLEFSLTKEWLLEKLSHGRCEATGLPFDISTGYGKGGSGLNSFSPSLDRVDAFGGYTPDNVQVVVLIYNRAKGLFPVSDLLEMASALVVRKDHAA